MVVLDKHALDTVRAMVNSGVQSPQDFDWLAQLRYYWTEGGASAQSGKPRIGVSEDDQCIQGICF